MDISHKLLQQQIRNRIIDNLESFADPTFVSHLGTDEIINTWYDYMEKEETFTFFTEPIYSKNEQNAIKRFYYLLESSYEKIPSTWQQEELQNNKDWTKLRKQAIEELNIFMATGRFSEEQEII